MLFSNQYSRRFFWPRLSVKPRQDLIAVTLRGFSQFPTELRQLSVLSVRAQSLGPSACSHRFPNPQGTVQQLFSKPPCCLLMCFNQHDKVSSQVPEAKDTTNKRATVLNATGRRWMKYSGHSSSSSVSVARVPMCVYRGTGSQPEHVLDDSNK